MASHHSRQQKRPQQQQQHQNRTTAIIGVIGQHGGKVPSATTHRQPWTQLSQAARKQAEKRYKRWKPMANHEEPQARSEGKLPEAAQEEPQPRSNQCYRPNVPHPIAP